MKGWLVRNEFITSDKFKELFAMFYKAALRLGLN